MVTWLSNILLCTLLSCCSRRLRWRFEGMWALGRQLVVQDLRRLYYRSTKQLQRKSTGSHSCVVYSASRSDTPGMETRSDDWFTISSFQRMAINSNSTGVTMHAHGGRNYINRLFNAIFLHIGQNPSHRQNSPWRKQHCYKMSSSWFTFTPACFNS